MDRKETLEIIDGIIDESTKAMKAEAAKLLETRDWDFNMFGDRNTFARTVMEVIFDREKSQYQAINNTRSYKQLKNDLAYELAFIKV